MPLEDFDIDKCSCSQYECDYCRVRRNERTAEAHRRAMARRQRETTDAS